jgi:hypothetical protein
MSLHLRGEIWQMDFLCAHKSEAPCEGIQLVQRRRAIASTDTSEGLVGELLKQRHHHYAIF